MKILKKRAIALLIDSFIFGSTIAILQLFFPNLLSELNFILKLLLFAPLVLRDVLFRNGSIGKKVMGISVYDEKWEKPKFKVLLFRSIGTLTIGYALLVKSMLYDGNVMEALDWERSKFGTRVIDDKVYYELKTIAEAKTGDFASNMTKLYNDYLRDLYS